MRTCYTYMPVIFIALAVCVECQLTGSPISVTVPTLNPCEEYNGQWPVVVQTLAHYKEHTKIDQAQFDLLDDFDLQMDKHCIDATDCATMRASTACTSVRRDIAIIRTQFAPPPTTPPPTSGATQHPHRQLHVLALGLVAVLTHITQPF